MVALLAVLGCLETALLAGLDELYLSLAESDREVGFIQGD